MEINVRASDGILSRSAGGNAAIATFGTTQIHSYESEAQASLYTFTSRCTACKGRSTQVIA